MMRRARSLLIGATLFWGLSFPLMRSLMLAQAAHAPGVSATAMACANVTMRFGLASVILALICGREALNVTRREAMQAVGLAFLAGTGLFLQTLGLAWTDASVAAFLTQLYTLIVPLIVAIRDRRLPGLRVWIACLLVLAGAAMLSPDLIGHLSLGPGELIIILSTGFLAGQIVWVERPVFAENRPLVVTMLMFALLALMFGPAYVAQGGTLAMTRELFGTPSILALSAGLLFFCTLFTFLIMNTWQRWVSATEAGIIYCIEPVIAAVLSGFLPGWISSWAGISYPNEALTWNLLIGGGLIVGATVLVATQKRTA